MKTTSPFLLILFLLLNLNVYSQEPVLLKDIHPTSSGSGGPFVEFNGEIYFTGFDGVTGAEPWVTDGTEAGTRLLKDISPGTGSSSPHSLIAIGPKLYFFANDGAAGNEIWSSDGTEAGTNGLSNINSGSSGQSNTTVITEYDGKAYFRAQGSTGMELYAADASGFITSFDIAPGLASSDPDHLIVSNNKLFFAASGPPSGSGRELWSIAGTSASLVKDLNPDPFIGSLQFGEFANSFDFNGLLFFAATTNGTNGTELFVSDGTTAGTNLFADLVPGSANSNPRNFIEFNNHMFFSAGAPGGTYRLWISDGTAGGTQLFGNINIGSNPGFTIVGSKMYFFNQVTPTVKELWVTDGTVSGTQLFLSSTTTPAFNNITLFTAFNNELYFSATPVGGSGTFLYKVGEDPATLEEVKPANSNSTNVFPRNLTVIGERLYYSALYDNLIGTEVYYIDALNPIVWTGNTSSNWYDITNWEPQQMPLEDDNVKIPDGRPNYPSIVSGQDVRCKQLILESGASFTMLTGSDAFIYGKITAPDAGVFNLAGGTMTLYHGSIFPPDMSFNHLTIKRTNDVESDNYYEIPGDVIIFGSLTTTALNPDPLVVTIPFIHLKENDVLSIRKNLIQKAGAIGLDINESMPVDRSKAPTIRMDGIGSQNIDAKFLPVNLYINNSNAKFTSTPTGPIQNLILNTNFDLAGEDIRILGKIIYTDGNNNSLKITNSKPTKGKLSIFNCPDIAYDDILPQYIKITKLKELDFNNGGFCNGVNNTLVIVTPLIVESIEVGGILDLNGNNLTIGATTHDRGRLEAESIVTEVASGTLKLLGNANTPQYVLFAKSLNNLVLNSPAGARLENGSNGFLIFDLYGTARLISGDVDFFNTFISLKKDDPLSPVNLGKIIETPGNIFYSTNIPCVYPDCGSIRLDTILSNPISNVNFGGLGLIITCPNSLNTIGVDRSNGPYQNLNGFTAISRMFRISNQNLSTSLDAQIKIKYDESELNGVNESDLKIFRISFENAENGPELWTELASSVNTTTNTVTSTTLLNQLDISPVCTFYTLGAFPTPLQGPVQSNKIARAVNSEMQVYPNPFNNTITTDLQSEANENATLKITDVSGKQVYTQSVELTEGVNTIKVDVNENLPSGIYILHIISLHTNKVVKIIKE